MKKKALLIIAAILFITNANAQKTVNFFGTNWRIGPKLGYSAYGYIADGKQHTFYDAFNAGFIACDKEDGVITELQLSNLTNRDYKETKIKLLSCFLGVDSLNDQTAGLFFRYGFSLDFLLSANSGSTNLSPQWNKVLLCASFGGGYEGKHLGFLLNIKSNFLTNVIKKNYRISTKPDFLPSVGTSIYYLF